MSVTPAEEAQLSMYSGGNLVPVPITASPPATSPFAQTFDRRLCNNITFQPTSGTMTMTAIWLPANRVVTGITFVSGATAESGGQNLHFSLYKGNAATGATSYTLMAQSTNDAGATTFTANLALRKALTTAQTTTYTGLYLIGFLMSNSLGAQVSLYNNTVGGVNANGNIAGMKDILASTADTSITNAAPSTLGTQTAITQALYAYVD